MQLKELFIVVAIVGVCIVALIEARLFWESLVFSLTLLVLAFTAVAAVAGNVKSRPYCLAFFVLTASYLLLAHTPDGQGNCPRQIGPEVSSLIIKEVYDRSRAFSKVAEPDKRSSGSAANDTRNSIDVTDNPFGGGSSTNNPFSGVENGEDVAAIIQTIANNSAENTSLDVSYGGQRVVSDEDLSAFMRIGHCAFGLLIGFVGAIIVRYIRRSD